MKTAKIYCPPVRMIIRKKRENVDVDIEKGETLYMAGGSASYFTEYNM